MRKKLVSKIAKIAVIFPSSPCYFGQKQKIQELLQNNGLEAKFFCEEVTKKSSEFIFQNAKSRYQHLIAAINCPDSSIIWCGRGGYGSVDLLPFLQQAKKPTKTKLIIGFSDISAIANFFIQKWGWVVLSAPMLIQMIDNSVSKSSQASVFGAIFDLILKQNLPQDLPLIYKLRELFPSQKPFLTAKSTKNLMINGQLVGGCLSVLCNNFGTKNQITLKEKILFLEDVDETAEKLDRYFNQIARVIHETKSWPKAIVLGNFFQGIEKNERLVSNINLAIQRFSDLIAEFTQNSVPVFQEIRGCLGHSFEMEPLFIGLKTKISVEALDNSREVILTQRFKTGF